LTLPTFLQDIRTTIGNHVHGGACNSKNPYSMSYGNYCLCRTTSLFINNSWRPIEKEQNFPILWLCCECVLRCSTATLGVHTSR
jgi:hypothetical protein